MVRVKLLTMLLSGLLTGATLAQSATRPARGPEQGQSFPRIRMILEDLKLSDDQKKKIEEVFTNAGENMRVLGPELRDLTQQQRMEKYREVINGLRDDIAEQLNADQKTKFNQAMQNVQRPTALGGPTTQPGAAQSTGPTQLMMRMRSRLEQLGLNDEQKQKVKKVLEDGAQKFKQLMASGERGSQEMREKAREIFEGTRDSLKEILTPEQFEKFSSSIREGFAGGGDKPVTQPKMIEEKMKDEKMSDEKMSPSDDKAKDKENDKPPSKGEDSKVEVPASAQVGQPAPAFTLKKVDGESSLELSAFKGKVVVLTFSSYSSPTFRRRAAALEEIRRKNDTRVNFLFVYTKESHPKGGWEVDRNKQEDVDVPQAKDLAERTKQAKRMHDALRFNWPMLADSMDNATAKAYGAGECTTLIIDRDGTIYSRLEWSDPYTLKRQLEELLTKPTSRPAV